MHLPEGILGKMMLFAYFLFFGDWVITKSDISWVLSLIVGVLAAANYIDQMYRRRKQKTDK